MRRLERERRGGSKAKGKGEGGRMGGSPRLFPSDPRCVKGANEKGEEELSAQKVFFGGEKGAFREGRKPLILFLSAFFRGDSPP